MSEKDANDLSPEEWTKIAEKNILDIANGAEGEQEKLDKEGNVHNLHFKLPPNFEANKFIAKNMSKGKWADKTEVTVTQTNLNLTASYEEVNRIIEKQRQKLIESKEQVIEAEFKEVVDEQ